MRKTVFAAALLAAASTSAFASAASSTFGGFYAGLNLGWNGSSDKFQTNTKDIDAIHEKAGISKNQSKNTSGLLYEFLVGYGKVFNQFYLGVEIGLTGDTSKRKLNLSASKPENLTPIDGVNIKSSDVVIEHKKSIGFVIAPRIGYVFDQNMIYFKLGMEFSNDKVKSIPKVINTANADVSSKVDSLSNSKTGLSLAPEIGYERKVNNLFFRISYAYNAGKTIKLDSKATDTPNDYKFSFSENKIKIGVFYQFNT